MIQTISALDKDDFANGQRFSFALPSQLPVNPNFTLKDNEGKSSWLHELPRATCFARTPGPGRSDALAGTPVVFHGSRRQDGSLEMPAVRCRCCRRRVGLAAVWLGCAPACEEHTVGV